MRHKHKFERRCSCWFARRQKEAVGRCLFGLQVMVFSPVEPGGRSET